LYLLVLGISMPLAAWSVIYRDLDHMISLALTALFYITPVFWKLPLGTKHGWIFAINPAMDLIELFRGPMYWGTWPSNPSVGGGAVGTWFIACAIASTTFVIGYMMLDRCKHVLAEVV